MPATPISREGYEKLREELRIMEDVTMPKIAEAIADARAEGDLKENAEYHGQREEQGRLQARINALRAKLADCYIVDRSTLPKGVVTFGTRVTLKNLSSGDEEQYEFVGPGEEDLYGDVMKILTTSPIAVGLMHKKIGDVVEVQVPRGKVKYEITQIEEVE